MTEIVTKIDNLIFKAIGQTVENLTNDKECEAYSGCNFQLGQLAITFRKAKITPKKSGQFVTLWKRNSERQTEPYSINNRFDFYIIAADDETESGFFFFPKQVLLENHILTTVNIEGKRGFRVYPDWSETTNKQALKTKSWQKKYFINLDQALTSLEKFKSHLPK